MVQIWIDDRSVEAPDGTSVLTAAKTLGLDIPALCHRDGEKPNTSCLCCLVRIDDANALVPACSTTVREGMRVASETAEIRDIRRTALELLLADHAGDCHAPCHHTCPARMDIPNMLRYVADGDYQAAIAVVKEDIALPAVLGRVCPGSLRARLPPGAIRQPRSHLPDQAICCRSGSRNGWAVPTSLRTRHGQTHRRRR